MVTHTKIADAHDEVGLAPGTEDRVGALSFIVMQHEGMAFRVSQWTFTPEERAAIAAGADLFLWVSSPQHPDRRYVRRGEVMYATEDVATFGFTVFRRLHRRRRVRFLAYVANS